jgi:endonuclease/exonuclease/phosphatase family metal-dependent hydrolase
MMMMPCLQVLIAAAVPGDQAGHVAALIMGDFNSKPGTPLYTFMRQGWVDCLQHHRKDMAGGQRKACIHGMHLACVQYCCLHTTAAAGNASGTHQHTITALHPVHVSISR